MNDEEAPAGVGEIDALKWYVHVMVIVSVLGAGGIWWLQKRTGEERASLVAARNSLEEVAVSRNEIHAMLAAFKKNKEDEARSDHLVWFQQRWKEKGIADAQISLGKWKMPPEISSDGKYVEEKIDLKFLGKNPLRREQIAQLLHGIESNSTRLRVLRMRVARVGREENLANDEWSGDCDIGYRYPHLGE